jgi:hypothetical protein
LRALTTPTFPHLPPYRPVGEGEPLLRDGDNASLLSRVTDEPPALSPSLLAKLGYGHGPADFTHPVTVEKQRVIWLPKDPLGLVKEIGRDIDSREVLHSTEAAEMDAKGYVDVTLAPENAHDADRGMTFVPHRRRR